VSLRGVASRLKARSPVHRWIRRGFLVWAVVSTSWMLNTFRTQGVDPSLLSSDGRVSVDPSPSSLAFLPARSAGATGLVFIVGAGVAAEAYAPLLRPIAMQGHPVVVIRLPHRIAPLEQHKLAAIAKARAILESGGQASRWVLAGHSLGGALASRIAANPPDKVKALVLIGTSHPKAIDLSAARIPVTKVFAANDGVATPKMVEATKHLVPAATRWIKIDGGNHSQFGHYGHQLFDGSPTISRERQQDIARRALLDALAGQPASAREAG
jgi:pimeloyl-ACP methyl ester carboxylesterase